MCKMSNRSILVFIFLGSLCFVTFPLHAIQTYLSSDELNSLVQAVKQDPTHIAKNKEILANLSSEQLATAIEQLGFTHYSWLHPVEIKGSELPKQLGKSFDSMSVMAVRGGKLVPIPYQFDDFDIYGFVYQRGQGPIDGEDNSLDKNDELVFMFRDTGDRQYQPEMPGLDGQILQELIFERNGKARYAYLVEGSAQRSDVDYVVYDETESKVETTFWGYDTTEENYLMFEDFYTLVGDKPRTSMVDAIYATFDTKILSPISPRIHLNSREHLIARPVGVKDGPVRTAVTLRMGLVTKGTEISFKAQMNLYDQGLNFEALISIPDNIPGIQYLTIFLHDPHLNVALDFMELEGAKVNSSHSKDPHGFALVDGKMSDFEKDMAVDVDDHPWMWMSSPYGWDFIVELFLPEDFDVSADVIYLDDSESKGEYENFAGSSPKMGYELNDFPRLFKEIAFEVKFTFPDQVGLSAAHFFEKDLNVQPGLEVREFASNDPEPPRVSMK